MINFLPNHPAWNYRVCHGFLTGPNLYLRTYFPRQNLAFCWTDYVTHKLRKSWQKSLKSRREFQLLWQDFWVSTVSLQRVRKFMKNFMSEDYRKIMKFRRNLTVCLYIWQFTKSFADGRIFKTVVDTFSVAKFACAYLSNSQLQNLQNVSDFFCKLLSASEKKTSQRAWIRTHIFSVFVCGKAACTKIFATQPQQRRCMQAWMIFDTSNVIFEN